MKRIAVLIILLISMCGCSSDVDLSGENRPVKIHDDVAAEAIDHVHISGNARSIIIQQSTGESFAFYNGDLNTAHTYEVHCEENDGTLDINILMENAEEDNDILGSVLIDIPQKEFEGIEVTGEFRQISLHTVSSDVSIHETNAFVNLDLEAAQLNHNITLDGSESKAFAGVSLYMDQVPDHVKMDLNPLPGGAINDPEDILKEYKLGTGSENPVISIQAANEINLYQKD